MNMFEESKSAFSSSRSPHVLFPVIRSEALHPVAVAQPVGDFGQLAIGSIWDGMS